MTNEEWKQVLGDWKQRVSVYQAGQYDAARGLENRHYWLGVPATVLAAIAGTTAFANLSKDAFSFKARLTVVIVSVLAAALTAVQTFFNYAQRAEKSRSASNQLGGVRKRIDILENFQPNSSQEMQATLEDLNKQITDVSKDAPLIAAPVAESLESTPKKGGFMGGHVMLR